VYRGPAAARRPAARIRGYRGAMTIPRIAVLSCLALVSLAPLAAPAAGPAVEIESGALAGASADGVASFRGIPYAAPPVGELRWRAPQPAPAWEGVREATAFGHDCMQVPEPADAAPPGTVPDEDCLVLNVWRPAEAAPEEKLPVLFWIHGGGYVNGGTSPAMYDGSALARRGLVVVSANYRLGRFGFFAHPALLAAAEGPVGNFGLMDQIAALRWVQRNVAAFGGDPGRVTLVGHSAGGDSVLHLLVSPETKGLFHGAVVLSGGGRAPILGGTRLTGGTLEQPSADQNGVEFANGAGIEGSDAAALAALRSLPAVRVADDLRMTSLLQRPRSFQMGPVVDGSIVVAAPGERLRGGEWARVPVLIGTTRDDLPTTFPPSGVDPLSLFGPDAAKAKQAYDPTLPALRLVLAIGVDLTMHEPARFVAKQVTSAGRPAWRLRFDYVAESMRGSLDGAQHGGELPFLFETLDARYGDAVTERDHAAARAFAGYVANFVRTGDPNGPGLPAWPRVGAAPGDLMILTNDGPVAQPDPWRERLDLVERAVEGR
jgi:para-nitrobenzyl esterase